MKRFLIAAALVCAPCLVACSKQSDVVVKTGQDKAFTDADIDRDPLALLPGGAIALSHVDAQQMFASRFGEKLLGLLTSQMPLPASAGFEPRISTLADDLLAKTGLVAAGLGVAIVPGLLLPSLRPDLAILRLRRPTHRGIYLVSRKGRTGLDDLVAALRLAE